MNVHLLRHAQHDRVGTILCGRMPGVRLSEAGRLEARKLASRFRGREISAIYTSPLERCQETAREIGDTLGLEPVVTDAFNEIDVGDWTGRSFDELGGDESWQAWNERRASGRATGGESMQAVQRRTMAEIETWRDRHPGQQVIVVSHCDVIKAVVCGVLGLSLDRYASFEIEPASASEIVAWRGGGKLLGLNEAVPS